MVPGVWTNADYTAAIDLLSIWLSVILFVCVCVESRRSLKHTAWDLRAKTLQNHKLNMSEEGAEAAAPAQDQNQGFFTGNIMNFERPMFYSRQENRLEALKAFKRNVVASSKEVLWIFRVKENVFWFKIDLVLKFKRYTTAWTGLKVGM